jgi:adenylate cyclase
VVALAVLARRPHWYRWVVNVLLALIIIENAVPTLLLGGLVQAELAMAWGLLAVIGALVALNLRAAFWWFAIYIASLIVITAVADAVEPRYDVEWTSADVASTLVGVTIFSFAAMAYFVRQRDRYQQESDDLLHNILPAQIAARLKTDSTMIADDVDSASVLFADIVGFTGLSARSSPEQVVRMLDAVFTRLDALVDTYGLEKIKTIGDAYMVAAGIPTPRADHAVAMARFALAARDELAEHNLTADMPVQLRIGINAGPVVAGVIGRRRFLYDLWGDTVNTASRMESHGIPGEIQISTEFRDLLGDQFNCRGRGTIDIKGKGPTRCWLLDGERAGAATG